LVQHLAGRRHAHPHHHNLPVPPWGPPAADVLIVGLAPGADGANRTGRPFVGDPSGDLLQTALEQSGLLGEVRITNAVKCLPPNNRPTAAEARACASAWLEPELASASVVLALGRLAHNATIRGLGAAQSAYPFRHLAKHRIGRWVLVDCYHPSPRNTRTGRLPPADVATALAMTQASVESLQTASEQLV
jgi:uracil-DNA glycosylase